MSIDLGSNSKRDEKMIKFDNFSKIEIFKFGSNFQVEIHKESNKSKKKFPLPLGLPLPLTPHLVKKLFDLKKKVIRVKIFKTQFFGRFSNFRARTHVSKLR